MWVSKELKEMVQPRKREVKVGCVIKRPLVRLLSKHNITVFDFKEQIQKVERGKCSDRQKETTNEH